MPTILQQNLAKEIVKNAKRKKPLNKKQLVVSSGYNEITADRHASEVIEQVGVTEALNDLGFSVDNAKKVVASIMLSDKAKDENRLRAASEVFKVHGTYSEGATNNNVLIINISEAILKKNNLKANDPNTSSE